MPPTKRQSSSVPTKRIGLSVMLSLSVAANVALGIAMLAQWYLAASERPASHVSVTVDWNELPRVFHDNPGSITDVSLAHDRSVGVRYDGIIWLQAREPALGDTSRLTRPHVHIQVITE